MTFASVNMGKKQVKIDWSCS